MAVPNSTYRVDYSGDGSTTEFAVPFYFLANGDLEVTHVASTGAETTWVEGADYSLTGAGDEDGGTLTATTAPADGTRLVIRRDLEYLQPIIYPESDPFPAASHEQGLDRNTMFAQQLQGQIDRTIKRPIGDPTTIDMTLDPAVVRAGKGLGFDGNGKPISIDLKGFPDDLSTALVTATDTITPRTLADRFRDTINLADCGADPTGAVACDAAWVLALAIAGTGDTIIVPPGRFRTTTPITIAKNINLIMNGVVEADHADAAFIVDGTGLGGGGYQGARYYQEFRARRRTVNHDDLTSDGIRFVTSYHGHCRVSLIQGFTTGLHFLPAAALDDLPDITSGASPYNKIEIGRIHNCLRSIHCDPNQNYPAWVTGEAVTSGDRRYHANRVYEAASSGTTGANGPRHTAGTASDGAVDWLFIRNMGFVNQNLFEGGRIHWPLGGRRRNSAGWEAALVSITGGNRANGNKFNNLSCEDGGVHRGIQPWQSGATVLKWDRWVSTDGERVYVAENDGTLDGSEPTHTTGTETHGDVTVRYAGRPHLSPYTPGASVSVGERRRYRDPSTGIDNDYEAASDGTAGLPGPTHTTGTETDGGGVDWTYLGRSFAEHRYSHSYEEGDLAWNREALFLCEGAGTTAAQTLGSKGPSDKSGNTFSDGTVTWRYIGPEYAWTIDGAGRQNEWATVRAERGRSIRFHAQDGNNVLRLGNYMRLKDFEDETVGSLGNEINCRGGGGAVDQGGGGFTPWRYETPAGAAIHLRSRSSSTDEALQISTAADPTEIRLGLTGDGIHRLFRNVSGIDKFLAFGRFATTPGTQRTWGLGSVSFLEAPTEGDPVGHVALSTDESPTWAAFGQVGYRTNSGSPSGVLTPKRIGEWAFDTDNADWYVATGLTNTDWKAIT